MDELNEPFFGQFAVVNLAAGLLGRDPKHSRFIDPSREGLKDLLLLSCRKAGGFKDIKPQGDAGADLVDVLPSRSSAAGGGEGDLL